MLDFICYQQKMIRLELFYGCDSSGDRRSIRIYYIYMPWWTSVIYSVHNFIASSAPKTIHQILYDIQYNISI